MNKEKRVWFGEDLPFNYTDGLMQLIDLFPEDSIIAEIGCFSGVSTSVFAARCSKVYAVDQWKEYREVDKEKIDKAKSEFNVRMSKYDNVEVLPFDSITASSYLKDCTLDAVYIDADHDYMAVMNDILVWRNKVKIGGFVCGHDYQQLAVHMAVSSSFGIPYMLFPDSSWCVRREK